MWPTYCHNAGVASTKQLLQTLSVVMQRLAAIELALLHSGSENEKMR